MSKIAMISGITGQDGSYLADLLLSKDKEYRAIIGLVRRSSTNTSERIKHIDDKKLSIIEADITDAFAINYAINRYKPDEFYHLAAMSHVQTSFTNPSMTLDTNITGTINVLESVRHVSPHTKLYFAASSEMWGSNYTEGDDDFKYQDEHTPFCPNSVYATSKLAGYNLVHLYRNAYSLFLCSGIAHNHESSRRGELFVTRKISLYVASLFHYRNSFKGLKGAINNEKFPKLKLGNINAVRDFGYAKDYVEAMYLMLQAKKPEDYVLATGVGHSIKDYLDVAFGVIGIKDWSNYVEIDKSLFRAFEVPFLQGRAAKIKKNLKWSPKTNFNELVQLMVKSDIADGA